MPDCPKLDPEQIYITDLTLSTLSNDQTLQALIEELDALLGSLAATIGEGQVTTLEILNGTILNEDIADGTIEIEKLAPGVIPSSVASGIADALPIGSVIPWAGSTVPPGFLLCDGSVKQTSLYPALSAVLGDGTSSLFGATTAGNFTLPNLLGRTIVGAGAGGGLTSRAIGSKGGKEAHGLQDFELAAHDHGLTYYLDDGGTGGTIPPQPLYGSFSAVPIGGYAVYNNTQFRTHSIGSGTPHENMPPFNVLTWIIRSDVAAPGQVTLTTPTDTATGIAVTAPLVWAADSQATAYQVQVDDTSNAFGSIVYDKTTGLTSLTTTSLAAATQHWWRVRALNPGGAGEWSTVWSFTTA